MKAFSLFRKLKVSEVPSSKKKKSLTEKGCKSPPDFQKTSLVHKVALGLDFSNHFKINKHSPPTRKATGNVCLAKNVQDADQFVDFGYVEEKLDSELWIILNKFLTLPVLATPVCLAEIFSVQSTRWDEKVAQMLTDMTRLKKLVKFDEEEMIGESYCKVVMYQRDIEAVVVETSEHKCRQSQFSVLLYDEVIQLKTKVEDNRAHVSVSKNAHAKIL